MCLNYAGTLLATMSEKGTLVRIWSTENAQPLQELRRGKSDAVIYSLCFDMKSQWLACSSDRETIHIFSVNVKLDQPNGIKLSDEEGKGEDDNENEEGERPQNSKSRMGFFGSIVPYFGSEWSLGKLKIPDFNANMRCVCAFTQDSQHLLVVTSNGKYYKAVIPKTKGNCKIVET